MADSSAARPKRLSVWAATEPLPAPMPPPPRIASQAEKPQTQPMPLEQPPGTSPAQSIQKTSAELANRDPSSLKVTHIIASIAISAIVITGVIRHRFREQESIDWPAIKTVFLDNLIEPIIPEPELPYITGNPLVPERAVDQIVRQNGKPATPRDRVRMHDILSVDSSADKSSEIQRL